MAVFNQDLLRKVEFYEYEMYLDEEIKAPFMLPHNSKFDNFSEYYLRCHFLIPSLLHIFNFIYISWIVDTIPLSQCCSNDYWWSKVQMKKWTERKWRKQGRETWYFDFKPQNQIFKFSQIYRIHNSWDLQIFYYETWSIAIKIFANLWHLWGSVYEAKLIMYRSSHPEVFCKKAFLKFAKFTRKHLCQSAFFNKVANLHPAALFKKTLRQRCF